MAIITATTTPVSSRQGQLCLFFFISIHVLYLIQLSVYSIWFCVTFSFALIIFSVSVCKGNLRFLSYGLIFKKMSLVTLKMSSQSLVH